MKNFIKKILTPILFLGIFSSLPIIVSAAFTSAQLSTTTPTNGYILETNGANNIWTPAFTNATTTIPNLTISNSLGLGEIMLVKRSGIRYMFYPTTDTDVARGVALVKAVAASQAGDNIYIGPGQFAVDESQSTTDAGLTLHDDVNFIGAGDNPFVASSSMTTATSTNTVLWLFNTSPSDDIALVPGSNETIANMNISAQVTQFAAVNNAPIGFDEFNGDEFSTNVTLRNVAIWGGTDNVLFRNNSPDTNQIGYWDIYDTVFNTNWDAINVFANDNTTPWGMVVNIYNPRIILSHYDNFGTAMRCISQVSGNESIYNIYNGSCTNATSTLTAAVKGVSVTGGGKIYLHNFTINPGIFSNSLQVTASSSLFVDAATQYDPINVSVTTGGMLQTIYPTTLQSSTSTPTISSFSVASTTQAHLFDVFGSGNVQASYFTGSSTASSTFKGPIAIGTSTGLIASLTINGSPSSNFMANAFPLQNNQDFIVENSTGAGVHLIGSNSQSNKIYFDNTDTTPNTNEPIIQNGCSDPVGISNDNTLCLIDQNDGSYIVVAGNTLVYGGSGLILDSEGMWQAASDDVMSFEGNGTMFWGDGNLGNHNSRQMNLISNGLGTDNLGIGTTSPYALLSIGTTTIGNVEPLTLLSVASSTNTLFNVLRNGNIGIGTTTPTSPLSVVGTTTLNTLREFFTQSTSQVNNGIIISTNQNSTSTGNGIVDVQSGETSIKNCSGNLVTCFGNGNTIIGVNSGAMGTNNKGGAGGKLDNYIVGIGNNFLNSGANEIFGFGNAGSNDTGNAGNNIFLGINSTLSGNDCGVGSGFTFSGGNNCGFGTNLNGVGQDYLLGNSLTGVGTDYLFGGSFTAAAANEIGLGISSQALTILGSNGNVGIATTTPYATLSVTGAPTQSNPYFQIASSTAGGLNQAVWSVDSKGHVVTGGKQPTLSSCVGGSLSASSNDIAGTITIPTGITACTVNFATAYAIAPTVTESDNSTGITGDVSSVSTTAFTIGLSANVGGITVYYQVEQ